MNANDKLRLAVEDATQAEMERVGPAAFNKISVLRLFENRTSRATLYRWIDSYVASGQAGRKITKQLRATAEKRVKKKAPPITETAAAFLPQPITIADTARVGGVPKMVALLSDVISNAQAVVAYAKTAEGGVRVPKLLLAASEHLRRSMDTALKLQESVLATEQVQTFHRDIIAAIERVAQEHPEAAEAIVVELARLSTEAHA